MTSTGPRESNISMGLLNVRTISNKGQLIHDLVNDHKFDFLCLTETWQQPSDYTELNLCTPYGFIYTCQARASGRGGSLAILYNEK